MSFLHTPAEEGTGCPVCGGADCKSFPDTPHPASYPFLPGGYEPMAEPSETHVPAPGPILIDGVAAFQEGQPVPIEQAKQLYRDKNWPGPNPAPRKAAKRARRPTEDRAKRPSEDR